MICQPCRDQVHLLCPEDGRQRLPGLTALERTASSLCDCQHKNPNPAEHVLWLSARCAS